tara:strand:- start:186 stop:842 length:657 start_codon:yes stop_codon:yes gene_type:complete
MNSIFATLELRELQPDPVDAFGLTYCAANAVVPSTTSNSEVQLRLLCREKEGTKLKNFVNWKPGTRCLVAGTVVFTDDTKRPLDVVVDRLFTNIPAELYINEVILGNAFFANSEYKENRSKMLTTKIGSTLDNSDITTWLFMETYPTLEPKLKEYIRKGRQCCVQGYLREYRRDDSESPYRAIVANKFTVRQDRKPAKPPGDGAYDGVDETPDFTKGF